MEPINLVSDYSVNSAKVNHLWAMKSFLFVTISLQEYQNYVFFKHLFPNLFKYFSTDVINRGHPLNQDDP